MRATAGTGEFLNSRARSSPIRTIPGVVARLLCVGKHVAKLIALGVAHAIARKRRRFLRFFVPGRLLAKPFPEVFRATLEDLGPAFVKIGQLLSARRDVVPEEIAEELEKLLDDVEPVEFAEILAELEKELGQGWRHLFRWIDPTPVGSASIAQVHRAVTASGEDVVLKVVKPGVVELVRRDAIVIRLMARLLQLLLPSYHPAKVGAELSKRLLAEVDMEREAANAETFAANFRDWESVVFPRVFRELTTARVLCMEWLEGEAPTRERIAAMNEEERRLLADLGAKALVKMLFEDGFFHADLHPANLRLLSGGKIGFVDMGMVGVLDAKTRRNLLYYQYFVSIGRFEEAARYLLRIAHHRGARADTESFVRSVAAATARWTASGASVGSLIIESTKLGARCSLYFPEGLVLMARALITYESMAEMVAPELDVVALSARHVVKLVRSHLSPSHLAKEAAARAPELAEALMEIPVLLAWRLRERETRSQEGGRGLSMAAGLYAGSCLIAAALLASAGVPWPVWAGLLVVGLLYPLSVNRS